MRSTRFGLGTAALALMVGLTGSALARDYLVFLDGAPQLEGYRARSSEVVARLKAAHAAAVQRVAPDLAAFGFDQDSVRPLWIAHALAVSADEDMAFGLSRLPGVASVEPVRMVPAPRFEAEEVAAPDRNVTWSIEKVNAPRVWQEMGLDGEGVVVGHIDTGIDPNHPDLAGKTIAFADFLDTNNTTPKDGQGHGTHTAGTIAGGSAGGTAIGMAPKAKLVVARVFSNQGATTEALLQSMQWILDPDGNPNTDDAPSLCSNSWGSNATSDKSFWQAVAAWRSAGVHPVFAAGNAGPGARTVGIPGGYPHSFAVGATTNRDGIARFSSRGPVKWDGQEMIKPDVSAPGQGVYSAKDGGGYFSISGTSMACPNVAGAIALIHQKYPGISMEAVEDALEATARDFGAPGKDNDFGFGIIDAYAAIASLSTSTISGRITGSDGQALAATLTMDGAAQTVAADGSFSIRAAAGSHTLAASMFGYTSVEETVELAEDQDLTVNLTLAQVPTGTVHGDVRGPEGEGVSATITVVDTPVDPVTSGADGHFHVDLPHGTYTLKVRALGYHAATLEGVQVNGSTAVDVVLEKARGVLVIDADGGANHQAMYLSALEDRPGGVDMMTDLQSESADLSGYSAVVWVGGDRRTSVPSSSLRVLASYLQGGGKLLMTGQNVAQGLANSSFMRQYLRARLKDGELATSHVYGQGGDLGSAFGAADLDTGDDGFGHSTRPDALEAVGGDSFTFARYKVLWGWVKRYAGVASRSGDSAAVLLGFGVEGLSGASARKQALSACLDWMQAGGEGASRMALFRALSK